MRGAVDKDPSNDAGFRVGLHTDQQSLILGEMMTAKNKLEEENRELRDKLQDAEMLIKYLEHKLRGVKKDGKRRKKSNSKQLALKARVDHALQWQTSSPKANQRANREAFTNITAPGKRLFETAVGRSMDKTKSESKGDKKPDHTYEEEKKEEDYSVSDGRQPPKTERRSSTASTQMESVIGKLAEVVISEYATEEELHIFN